MRTITRSFTEMVEKTYPLPAPIVEIGSRQVEGHPELADLRPVFPDKRFIGCDMLPGAGVDQVEDIHALTFADESVGTVIALDTLEHVKNPFRAMEEIHRVLIPEGVVIITSVMLCEIHGYPHDYWRFTPQGFEVLLENFSCYRVYYDMPEKYPRSVFGVGFKGAVNEEVFAALDAGFTTHVRDVYMREKTMSVVDMSGDLHILTRRKTRGKLLFVWRFFVNLHYALKGKKTRI